MTEKHSCWYTTHLDPIRGLRLFTAFSCSSTLIAFCFGRTCATVLTTQQLLGLRHAFYIVSYYDAVRDAYAHTTPRWFLVHLGYSSC